MVELAQELAKSENTQTNLKRSTVNKSFVLPPPCFAQRLVLLHYNSDIKYLTMKNQGINHQMIPTARSRITIFTQLSIHSLTLS